MAYICNGILLSHKNEILPFVAVDLEGITLSETNERQILYNTSHMQNLKILKQKRSRLTESELVVTSGEREGGGAT